MTKEQLKESGHHKRAGQMGGEATKKKETEKNPNYYSENGLKGWQKVKSRFHSPEEMKAHFSALGKIGKRGDKKS